MIPGLKRRTINFYDVMMYVAIVRKHLRLMMLIFCFCITGVLLVYVYARPVFYSRSTVKVDALALPLDTEKIMHDSNIQTVISQLTAHHVIERAAHRLGVDGDFRAIQKHFIKKIAVRVNSQKNLEMEVWPYSYEWAEKFPELLVQEFLLDREERRTQFRDTVIESYEREMESVGKKLDENIASKFKFLDARDATRAQIEFNQLRQLPREIMLVGKRLGVMDDIKKRVEEPTLDVISKLALISSLDKDVEVKSGQIIGTEPMGDAAGADQKERQGVVVVPSMIEAEHPWETLVKEKKRLEQERNELSARFLPAHPKMAAVQKQIDEVDKRLDAEYETAKTRFDLDYANLVARKKELEAKLPKYHEANKQNEKILLDTGIIGSNQTIWNSMRMDMSKLLDELSYDIKERVNLQFAGISELKDTPVSPNKLHLFLLAVMAALGFGIGIPFLIEYLDHTVSNLEQVEATFRMRGLGIIPKIGAHETHGASLIDLKSDPDRHLIENFRVIRTNLLSVGTLTKAPHVIMVTSAMPKEGKTVVSSNLAISFAHTGTRTLVLDTDLRRGRLHRVFGVRKSPGLSDVLLNQLSIDEAIRPTNKENLSILSAGQHLDSGSELLGSQRFTDIMDQLRSRFDRIIVDTPPVLGLSETSILQKHVDGVLFVIWSGRTPLRNMKVAVEMLQANGANFYGFILNRLDLSATTNYYQYYYYSNDYYHNYHALENA